MNTQNKSFLVAPRPNVLRVAGFIGALIIASVQALSGDLVGAAGVFCAALSTSGLKKGPDASAE